MKKVFLKGSCESGLFHGWLAVITQVLLNSKIVNKNVAELKCDLLLSRVDTSQNLKVLPAIIQGDSPVTTQIECKSVHIQHSEFQNQEFGRRL